MGRARTWRRFKPQAVGRGIHAGRGRRPERGGAVWRAELLRLASDARDRARGRRRRGARPRRLLRTASRTDHARAAVARRHACLRSRLRLARPHALALRRPGLHGKRHAGSQKHRRWMDEPGARGDAWAGLADRGLEPWRQCPAYPVGPDAGRQYCAGTRRGASTADGPPDRRDRVRPDVPRKRRAQPCLPGRAHGARQADEPNSNRT